jgi:hypothetical protein
MRDRGIKASNNLHNAARIELSGSVKGLGWGAISRQRRNEKGSE